jgi:uncharacterized membrane protein YhiD involved in acid resistance
MVQNEGETFDRQTPSRLFRVMLDGVSYRWAGWGLTAHAALTLGGTVWAASHAVFIDGYTEAYDLYLAIGIGLIRAFAISVAAVVTVSEVIDTTMVIAHFVGQKMKAEGRAEGRAEAEKEMRAQMAGWLDRLLAQHPELKDSIEPLPGTQTENGGNRDKPQEEH